ncbi:MULTISPECIES: sulfate ABC transporter permease subunit CysT [Limnospira]|uniref:sulfate ABC transporter permease subunit CysT n=1 Tax=Limnospira TaxID=2596745 RepID=UPI00144A16A2|nr:sulfate ABC transporter permease subunit CysT [Limnospira sp. PMC 1042.18]MDT9197673.1 sulfate ABC transporter permease subunit CysT [Limnospira sp. PMC 1042.18]QJB26613.1 sulfate ABC transporter permease subunit CysT [Limnospira fusiformis SAG 85.79]
MITTSSKTPSSLTRFLPKIPWYWWGIGGYLSIMLLLPILALILFTTNLSWAEIWRITTDPVALYAYRVTFFTAIYASSINGIAGVAVAWVLVRYRFPGKEIIDAAIDLPFALPTAVAGLSLATVYAENGWIGSLLAPLGIKIAFTRLGVGLAMIFISLPFVVRTVQPVLQELEPELEEVAWCMGASRWQTFRRVILPPLIPAILTGVALGFSRAVGEYGSIVIIAGNIPFQDLIAPVLIFQRLEQFDYAGAAVIGTVMLLVSLGCLLIINCLQSWGNRINQRP